MTDTVSYVKARLQEIADNPDLRSKQPKKLRYVSREVTRHGKPIYYFRRGKGDRIRLPDPELVGEATFQRAYNAAVSGKSIDFVVPRRSRLDYMSNLGGLGYVYFIKMGNAVKIGFTTSIGRRLSAIQTSCPEPAEVIKVVPGSQATEQFFHDHFAKYRLRGEWFSLEGNLVAFLY